MDCFIFGARLRPDPLYNGSGRYSVVMARAPAAQAREGVLGAVALVVPTG